MRLSIVPRSVLELWPCALALTVLLLSGGLAAWGGRARVNADGISYLQLASYLREGDVAASVSGYWSPLLIWSLVPSLAAGVERLLAAWFTLVGWAAVGVVASDRLAARLELAPIPRAATLVVIALALSDVATEWITPDVVVGSCLLAYSACVMHPDLLRWRRRAALAGAWLGVAYLGKSYALPFALVHVPLVVLLRWRGRSADEQASRPGRAVALMTVAVVLGSSLLVALPWIDSLSRRYHRLTWTTVGPIAHRATGPHVAPGSCLHPVEGMLTPAAPHRSVWETPEVLPYPEDWSPFASRANAAHQVAIIKTNLSKVKWYLGSWDLVGLVLPALALAPLAVWLTRRGVLQGLSPSLLRWCSWLPATFVVYVAGYALVYVEERYLRSFLLPLAVLLLGGGASALDALLRTRLGTSWPAHALTLAVCALFAAPPALSLGQRAFTQQGLTQAREEFHLRLGSLALPGPVAFVCHHDGRPHLATWFKGQELAFHMDRTFVGLCHLVDEQSAAALDDHGVATLLAVRPYDVPLAGVPGFAPHATLPMPDQPWLLDVLVRR